MKTLSLTQPWATLVAIGAKRIETRSWSTGYRGPLAIHAAKGFPKYAREFAEQAACYEVVGNGRYDLAGWPDAYPLGYVLATCRLVSCVPVDAILETISERERAVGDYSSGRWAWVLGDVKALAEPIAVKGALGLWEFEGLHELAR